MRIGKISESVLKRSVLKRMKNRREDVLLGPGVGEDAAAIEVGLEDVVMLTTDPVTATTHDMGAYGVYAVANDLLAGGARPVGVLCNIILPPNSREIMIKRIMDEIETCCRELDMQILGGHTEVTAAVNQPVLTVSGVGKCKKFEISPMKKFSSGDVLVMTKWAGAQGAAILAKDHEEQLTSRYTRSFIEHAQQLGKNLSIAKEVEIAKRVGVTGMHDVAQGGIYGALWDVASAAGVGFEVDLGKIPIKQETVEISEFFDINPYQLMSAGCLLLGTKNPDRMIEELTKEGICAEVIGKVMSGNDKVILRDGERFFLEPIKSDELFDIAH